LTGTVWFLETDGMPSNHGSSVVVSDGARQVAGGTIGFDAYGGYFVISDYSNLQPGTYTIQLSVYINQENHDPDTDRYPLGTYNCTISHTVA